MVTPSLGGKHSNVAIMVEVNTLKGSTNTLADISDNDNTNTATTKNTTRISYLKNLVDIDGKDSDVDLTVLSILSTVIAVLLNIPIAFVKLEISQLLMSWLKACVL
jgi:hypothetical protein